MKYSEVFVRDTKLSKKEKLLARGKMKELIITLKAVSLRKWGQYIDSVQAEYLARDTISKLAMIDKSASEKIENLKHFAIRVLVNQRIDDWRKTGKRETTAPINEATGEQDFDLIEPSRRLDAREISEASVTAPIELNELLASLSENCSLLLLAYAKGSSYQKISDALAINLGTVKSRMARCRLELAGLWD
jgi:RNA polymerase sigma factor (sigma-70 family)